MADLNGTKVACKELVASDIHDKQEQQSQDQTPYSAYDAVKQKTTSFREFLEEAKILARIPPSPYVVRLVGLW